MVVACAGAVKLLLVIAITPLLRLNSTTWSKADLETAYPCGLGCGRWGGGGWSFCEGCGVTRGAQLHLLEALQPLQEPKRWHLIGLGFTVVELCFRV